MQDLYQSKKQFTLNRVLLFTRQKMSELYIPCNKLNILPGQKVLDLGCGNHVSKMFHMNNVDITYVDKEPKPKDYNGNSFIQHDLDNGPLPFPHKYFDFVVCSAVLEHVNNPLMVVREINRVGKRGAISTPSIFTEMFWNWNQHLWIIVFRRGRLMFLRKKPHLLTNFKGYFHIFFKANDTFNNMRLQEENLRLMYVRVIWENKIEAILLPDVEDIFDIFISSAE
jgi:ubiquinone/menaquinone biosynthesis C-methylase UbiE